MRQKIPNITINIVLCLLFYGVLIGLSRYLAEYFGNNKFLNITFGLVQLGLYILLLKDIIVSVRSKRNILDFLYSQTKAVRVGAVVIWVGLSCALVAVLVNSDNQVQESVASSLPACELTEKGQAFTDIQYPMPNEWCMLESESLGFRMSFPNSPSRTDMNTTEVGEQVFKTSHFRVSNEGSYVLNTSTYPKPMEPSNYDSILTASVNSSVQEQLKDDSSYKIVSWDFEKFQGYRALRVTTSRDSGGGVKLAHMLALIKGSTVVTMVSTDRTELEFNRWIESFSLVN